MDLFAEGLIPDWKSLYKIQLDDESLEKVRARCSYLLERGSGLWNGSTVLPLPQDASRLGVIT